MELFKHLPFIIAIIAIVIIAIRQENLEDRIETIEFDREDDFLHFAHNIKRTDEPTEEKAAKPDPLKGYFENPMVKEMFGLIKKSLEGNEDGEDWKGKTSPLSPSDAVRIEELEQVIKDLSKANDGLMDAINEKNKTISILEFNNSELKNVLQLIEIAIKKENHSIVTVDVISSLLKGNI